MCQNTSTTFIGLRLQARGTVPTITENLMSRVSRFNAEHILAHSLRLRVNSVGRIGIRNVYIISLIDRNMKRTRSGARLKKEACTDDYNDEEGESSHRKSKPSGSCSKITASKPRPTR